MGMFKPEVGETHRFVLELEGTETLCQEEYEEYKREIANAVKKIGAKITIREYVKTMKKKPKKKGGK